MNAWTFLDRNAGGFGLLLLILAAVVFSSTGDGHGCRVRCGTTVVEAGAVDAGAP